MEYRTLFKNTKIPKIGLGTWKVGGEFVSDYSSDLDSIEAIKNAIKMGYTHIDTAELYGNGHCEELVGKAIEDFERNKLFITTKVFKTNLGYYDVINSCKNSLNRLQLDFVDLYLIHSFNPDIPLKMTMKALDCLVEEGYIKYIGVSNFRGTQIEEAQKYTKNKIVMNQIEYNLSVRNGGMSSNNIFMEEEVIPYCQKNNIIITAYRPFDGGNLLDQNELLEQLARKYNSSVAQIALKWLINKKNIITIPQSLNVDHLKENLDVFDWDISEEDMHLLDVTKF